MLEKRISLPETLDIVASEQFLNLLRTEPTANIEVDCSQIKKITTPGIQLLISLVKTAGRNSQNLKFINGSSIFEESLELFGLNKNPNQWEVK